MNNSYRTNASLPSGHVTSSDSEHAAETEPANTKRTSSNRAFLVIEKGEAPGLDIEEKYYDPSRETQRGIEPFKPIRVEWIRSMSYPVGRGCSSIGRATGF